MSQRQRSRRLSLVFERLSKRKRAAKQAARKARSAEENAAQRRDQPQPAAAAADEDKDKD